MKGSRNENKIAYRRFKNIYTYLQQLISTCLSWPLLIVGLRTWTSRHTFQSLNWDWPRTLLTYNIFRADWAPLSPGFDALMWAWLSMDMSIQKKPSFLTASPWIQSKGLSVFLVVLSLFHHFWMRIPYLELPTVLHSPWQTANTPDTGPCSLFLQMPAEVWPNFNREMMSTLIVPTICCFVHYYIKSLHTHTNLNHTMFLGASWPPRYGRQSPGKV